MRLTVQRLRRCCPERRCWGLTARHAAGELEVSRRRLIALEAKAERAELELEAVGCLEEILQRPLGEAYRQAASLTEQALHQRLENSKVRRELSLQTEKVRYLEAVNAELEARLEEYEAEAFRHQVRAVPREGLHHWGRG